MVDKNKSLHVLFFHTAQKVENLQVRELKNIVCIFIILKQEPLSTVFLKKAHRSISFPLINVSSVTPFPALCVNPSQVLLRFGMTNFSCHKFPRRYDSQ